MSKPILRVTAADVRDGVYVGSTSVDGFDGHLEVSANLGWVRFEGSVRVTGFVFVEAGSGIEAGGGIEAGSGIEAGGGIKAGWGIEAGWGIKAGSGIKAGGGIKAGWGIEAGWGIKAGLSITCTKTLTVRFRVFAGTCTWKLATDTERTITCGTFKGGEIGYGLLVETTAKKTVKS